MNSLTLTLSNNTERIKSFRKNTYTSTNPNVVDKDEKEDNLEFEEIHEILVDSFNRKKYRKVYEFIDTKESILEQSNLSYQLFFSHMKMNCVLKIIEKKFNKYYKSTQIKGVEKWFKFSELILNKFSFLIHKIHSIEKKDQCEYIILYHIKIYYYRALYSKFKNENKDYICYLIMAEEIIKNIIDIITFRETFIYIIRIYLLLSNLLIQDNAIFSSINYLLSNLQICKIVKGNEIELQMKKEKKIDNIFITNKENESNINKVNFNIFIKEINFLSSITFCLLGVCFEYLNEYFLSNSAYRQAKWISQNLNDYEYSNLSKLLGDLVDKSNKEKNLITILCRFDMIKFINKYKNIPKKKSFDSFDNKKLIKYKIIEKKISKLHLQESEQLQHILLNNNSENKQKSKNIKLMTNNVILLNYLSSDQFKPVIYNIKNMNIYNMNKETEMLITKKLESIKNKNKINKQFKKCTSKNSVNDSKKNSPISFKKLRSRKRFQTDYNNINLLNKDINNDPKNKLSKLLDNNKEIKKTSSKNVNNVSKNKSILKNKRKMSIEFGNTLNNEYLKNNNLSLNDSSFLDNNNNIIKNKELKIGISLSNKKSSDISENSSILNLFHSPKKNIKITFNNNEISKNDKNKILNKKGYKIKGNNKKNNQIIPINNKYKLDKYIFNKVYIKKLEHIEKLTNKEYKFQKGILKNKSYEQFPQIKFEPEKDKKEAEFLFIKALDEKLRILEEKVQGLGESDKKDYFFERKMKRKLLLYKTKACISLNYKDKEKYYNLIREINNEEKEKEKNINKNSFLFRNNSTDFNIKKINENNNIQMNILGGKIEKIEKKISKSLSKIKNKNNKKMYFFESKYENKIRKNKSTKEINRNRILINNNKVIIKLDKPFIENNRKSVNIKTDLLSPKREFFL